MEHENRVVSLVPSLKFLKIQSLFSFHWKVNEIGKGNCFTLGPLSLCCCMILFSGTQLNICLWTVHYLFSSYIYFGYSVSWSSLGQRPNCLRILLLTLHYNLSFSGGNFISSFTTQDSSQNNVTFTDLIIDFCKLWLGRWTCVRGQTVPVCGRRGWNEFCLILQALFVINYTVYFNFWSWAFKTNIWMQKGAWVSYNRVKFCLSCYWVISCPESLQIRMCKIYLPKIKRKWKRFIRACFLKVVLHFWIGWMIEDKRLS